MSYAAVFMKMALLVIMVFYVISNYKYHSLYWHKSNVT